MDGSTFDALSRSWIEGTSRRAILGGIGTALGLAALRAPSAVDAKKKRRKATKKLRRNTYGCVDVGQACRGNDANCCSGICDGKKPKKGKKDKSRCAGHDAGLCQVDEATCAPLGTSCGPLGVCDQTTGKACYCVSIGGNCAVCAKDADCVALGWGANAACIPSEGCPETGGTHCAPSGI
jgi:hypothetical protein